MQPLVGVEHGREARFDVHDAVAVHVLDHLVGDTLERGVGLHHAARVSKPFEVQRQAAALRPAVKPGGELARVAGGQRVVALFARQLDCRRRPQAAVEVVVQEDLGHGSDRRVIELHEHSRVSILDVYLRPKLNSRRRSHYTSVNFMTAKRKTDTPALSSRARGARAGGPPAPPPAPAVFAWWPVTLIVAAIVATYWNSLHVPFIGDDVVSIVQSPSIRKLWDWAVLFAEDDTSFAGRPLVNITFAINYAIGGLDVRGYHL